MKPIRTRSEAVGGGGSGGGVGIGGIDGGVGGTGGRRVVLGSYVQQGLRAVSREVKIRFPDLEKQLGASRESNEGGGKHFDTIGFRPHLLKMKQHMEAAEDVYRAPPTAEQGD